MKVTETVNSLWIHRKSFIRIIHSKYMLFRQIFSELSFKNIKDSKRKLLSIFNR